MSHEQALEQARCAYVNLNTLARMAPTLKQHPIFALTRMQIRECIGHLDGGDFCAIEDEQSGA